MYVRPAGLCYIHTYIPQPMGVGGAVSQSCAVDAESLVRQHETSVAQRGTEQAALVGPMYLQVRMWVMLSRVGVVRRYVGAYRQPADIVRVLAA